MESTKITRALRRLPEWPRRLALRPRLPRRTVRLRLTLLYGGLFLLCGAGLLGATYLLVRNASSGSATVTRGKHGEVVIRAAEGAGGATLTLQVHGHLPPGLAPAGASSGGALPRALIPNAGKPSRGSEASSAAGASGQAAGAASQATGATGQVTGAAGQVTTRALGPPNAKGLVKLPPEARKLLHFAEQQHEAVLDQLLIQSGIALLIVGVVSLALGWVVAGRVLSPLRTMTMATRRISQHNLHERLALQGPSDELKELADTIDGLLSRLEAAFEAQRRFVANASHELRTPLAMMRTSLDVTMGKREPPPPQTATLDAKLREGLNQADRLLESFLTLARAQHGALPEHSAVSLSTLVEDALAAQREPIASAGIEVRSELAPVQVEGSPTLLARMVGNVIDNAVRHNVRDGWLLVRTRIEGHMGEVTVESGGAALDERRVQRLAQPFERLGAQRTGSEGGVGLGLSIVAAIATAHGGALRLQARAEGGLSVSIALPGASLALGAASQEAKAGCPPAAQASSPQSTQASSPQSAQAGPS